MKTYTQIRNEKKVAMDALLLTLGVFFAFSNKQFKESKTHLAEGDKYVRFASGSYIAKSRYAELEAGFAAIDKAERDAIKANQLEEAEVLYELENHECFYTGSIEDAMYVLGEDYTREFVKSVYFKNQSKYEDQGWFN